MYRIPLHVSGVDLSDPVILNTIKEELSDLVWTESGRRVLAVAYTDLTDPVGMACEAARRIMYKLHGTVHEVDQDLVNISDIAHRIGFSREAVRHWAEGNRGPGNFPAHIGVPGHQKVWRWGDVSAWLHKHYALTEDESSLSSEQILQLNSALKGVAEHIDHEWRLIGQPIKSELHSQHKSPSPMPATTSIPPHVRNALLKLTSPNIRRSASLPEFKKTLMKAVDANKAPVKTQEPTEPELPHGQDNAG